MNPEARDAVAQALVYALLDPGVPLNSKPLFLEMLRRHLQLPDVAGDWLLGLALAGFASSLGRTMRTVNAAELGSQVLLIEKTGRRLFERYYPHMEEMGKQVPQVDASGMTINAPGGNFVINPVGSQKILFKAGFTPADALRLANGVVALVQGLPDGAVGREDLISSSETVVAELERPALKPGKLNRALQGLRKAGERFAATAADGALAAERSMVQEAIQQLVSQVLPG